jgi:hypothetical protein
MADHLPSVRALESSDDALLSAELERLAIRRRAAVVRALADEIERAGSQEMVAGLCEQIHDELTRAIAVRPSGW